MLISREYTSISALMYDRYPLGCTIIYSETYNCRDYNILFARLYYRERHTTVETLKLY